MFNLFKGFGTELFFLLVLKGSKNFVLVWSWQNGTSKKNKQKKMLTSILTINGIS
jgi:hypothetical protein